MNHRESPLYWSFPIGRWFATDIRVSVFFPLILAVLCLRYGGTELGLIFPLTFAALLFLSVLLHEFGHVVGARKTGGSGNEILLWPLGGLAFVQPAQSVRSQFLTSAAGPLVNLSLCMTTLYPVIQSAHTADALNPLILPAVSLQANTVQAVLVLLFSANWMLLLLNLIPVYPLDGGKMVSTLLVSKKGRQAGFEIYSRIGLICAFIIMIVGLLNEEAWVVAIGAVILALNFQETMQTRMGESSYDDSFMGYDFSQGYTSLERDEDESAPKRKSKREERKERKEAEKREKEAEIARQEERLLDELLAKVSSEGYDSLSETEKRTLTKVSARYRDKDPS